MQISTDLACIMQQRNKKTRGSKNNANFHRACLCQAANKQPFFLLLRHKNGVCALREDHMVRHKLLLPTGQRQKAPDLPTCGWLHYEPVWLSGKALGW